MITVRLISKTKKQKVEFSQVVVIDSGKRKSETKHIPSEFVEKFKKFVTSHKK